MSEQENVTPEISAADDTKTKKTIRLRPVLAKPAPSIEPAPAAVKPVIPIAPAGKADASADTADTQTRKTIKLKPLMPKVASTSKTVDPLAIPKPAAFQPDGDDTKTRRAIQLSQAEATVKPATIDISKASAPEAGSSDDDRTVKVKRPVIAKPVDVPRPALKFNRPATPATPVKPASAVVPPRPAVPPAAPVTPIPAQVNVANDDVCVFDDDDEEPGKLQTALSVVAAVALLASATLLALNYFDITF